MRPYDMTTNQLDEIICLSELCGIPYYIAAVRLGYIDQNDDQLAAVQYLKIRIDLVNRRRFLDTKANGADRLDNRRDH